jgi:hypothetical protein
MDYTVMEQFLLLDKKGKPHVNSLQNPSKIDLYRG